MIAYLVVSSFFISLLSFFFFWAVVLKKDLKFDGPSLAFCIFSFSIFVWSAGHMLWLLSSEEDGALHWIRVLVIGSIFVPFAYFHFVVNLLERRSFLKYVVVGYGLAFLLSFFALGDFLVSGVEPRMNFTFWPVPGLMFPAYLGSYTFMAAFGVGLLAAEYRRVGVDKKNQLRYVLIGTGVGFVGGATNFFLWLNIPIPPFGQAAVIFYVLGLGYSMLKFRILDFSEMGFRVLGLVALAITFSGLFTLGLVSLMKALYPAFFPNSYSFWWSILSLVSICLLSFGPSISEFFNQFLHDRFLAKRFAYRAGLQELSSEIRFGGELLAYYDTVVERLTELLRLSSAGLYVRSESSLDYLCVSERGDKTWLSSVSYEQAPPFLNLFSLRKGCFTVAEIVDSKDGGEILRSAFGRDFGREDIIAPIFGGHELFGFLVLCPGQNRTVIAELDLLLLENICSQLGLMLVFRDIERKSNQVEKLVSLGTMAAGLSHELRNPLVSVQTLVSLLNRDQGAGNITPEFRGTLSRDVKRIQGILDGVLAYSKNTDGNMKFLALRDLFDETLELVAGKAKDKQIEVTLESEILDVDLMADFDQLVQVLQNLIDNSINAIAEWDERPEVGIIKIRAELRGKPDKDTARQIVVITVTDNGPGIPENIGDKVFEPFVTSRDTGHRSGYAGTGLGLAIVSKIIERHEGVIRVSSGSRGGAQFTITLPVCR